MFGKSVSYLILGYHGISWFLVYFVLEKLSLYVVSFMNLEIKIVEYMQISLRVFSVLGENRFTVSNPCP